MYEHIFIENIKRLYKTARKCEDHQQYNAMIEEEILSTNEGCTGKILMTPNPSVSTKNPSARKSIRQFTEILDIKHKTSVCGFGAAKA